jgi:hypothetical protein
MEGALRLQMSSSLAFISNRHAPYRSAFWSTSIVRIFHFVPVIGPATDGNWRVKGPPVQQIISKPKNPED